MKKYKIGYIVRPNLEETGIKAINDRFEALFSSDGGQIIEKSEWGLKDLAYEINHHKKGHYVWFVIEASTETINEFNRLVGINEDIIRYIVTVSEE